MNRGEPGFRKRPQLGPPGRWMHCPRKSQLIAGLFVAFKTPLDKRYNRDVPEECRFYPAMAMGPMGADKKAIGLWIDLTNTTRFYDSAEVEKAGIEYRKLNCKGFGECPSDQQTQEFINLCKIYSAKCPDKLIAVHCTHGFNRTGFLIVSYLVLEKDFSLDAAVSAFAAARPPGIYKQDYIDELFNRLDDGGEPLPAPRLPQWCHEEDEEDDDRPAPVTKRRRYDNSASQFAYGVCNVETVTDSSVVENVRNACRNFCRYGKSDFPGLQPVSLDKDNLRLLVEKPYVVSWKADGTRYMMFIDGPGCTYLIDRDNKVFVAPSLTFLHRDGDQPITATLVDGELVLDEDSGRKTPRYLMYDIVAFEGQSVCEKPFPERQRMIDEEIIEPRLAAFNCGRIRRDQEPFGIRLKRFYDMGVVQKVLRLKPGHETDGLIFQPVNDAYVGGRCRSVLKWKPAELNSVDFRLEIRRENRLGMIAGPVGHLMVLDCDRSIGKIEPVPKELMQYDNKIIECTMVNGHWKFLRHRTDKSVPNSFETAEGVRKSIRFPITEGMLMDYIRTRGTRPRAPVAAAPTVGGATADAVRPRGDRTTVIQGTPG